MSNHKVLTVLYKHKELLKKDMTKKRLLMEKDCTIELQVRIYLILFGLIQFILNI